MKEDYLWEKTGGDAEIEKLETALLAFRYKETAPPAIPAKILPFAKKEKRLKTFSFMRAIAACLAVTSISLGVWMFFANSKAEIAADVSQKPVFISKTADPLKQLSENNVPAQPEIKDQSFYSKTVHIEKDFKPKSLHIKKSGSKSVKRNKIPKTKEIEETIHLTEEEKHAFEQLMLALSITSSKLKIVKEKVNGAENQTASFK